ncbi:MAG: tetratricopeptide repeat protein [Rhodocyclaceae bacterium]|nr:tetratricopeptide repeat protein [Rhodocyclaceae bacterium]
MKNTRTHVLLALLLALVALVVARPELLLRYEPSVAGQQGEPPLPGTNAIKGLAIRRDGEVYAADVSYFYRGDAPVAQVRVFAASDPTDQSKYQPGMVEIASRGEHQVTLNVLRPKWIQEAVRTQKVVASLEINGRTVSRLEIDYGIAWPDPFAEMQSRRDAQMSDDDRYRQAVTLIDSRSRNALTEAKRLLDRIIINQPDYVDAYPELARHAMMTMPRPGAFDRAEEHLQHALALQPGHANSHVLLGYVFAHQDRFDEAEAEFERAQTIGTANLWLWANWGELLRMQGRDAEAIAKYLQAIDGARPFNTYDVARQEAYRNLLDLLETRGDVEKLDELYARRSGEFPENACFLAAHAEFKLFQKGDFDGAIEDDERAVKAGCDDRGVGEVLGVAYYMAWSAGQEPDKARLLAKARVFLPEGPRLYLRLSTSDRTAGLLEKFNEDGRIAAARDADNMTAIAYALAGRDLGAARRLMGYGASLTDSVGSQQIQVALIPVFNEDLEGIRFVLESGIDPASITFRGASLVDIATQSGNPELVELVRKARREL